MGTAAAKQAEPAPAARMQTLTREQNKREFELRTVMVHVRRLGHRALPVVLQQHGAGKGIHPKRTACGLPRAQARHGQHG